MPSHRLRELLTDAAEGRFPPADLAVEVVGRPRGRSDAVVAFSGHNVIAAPVERDEIQARLPDDDPGGPMSAPFLTWLGERLGSTPGMLDAVLVADRIDAEHPSVDLQRATDATASARVERALRYRSEVAVYEDRDRSGIVILGRGLVDRLEVSIELAPEARGRGRGAALAHAARGLVPDGEPLFAQVSPGNVASLRAFLRAGYRPICSEVLFLRHEAAADVI